MQHDLLTLTASMPLETQMINSFPLLNFPCSCIVLWSAAVETPKSTASQHLLGTPFFLPS